MRVSTQKSDSAGIWEDIGNGNWWLNMSANAVFPYVPGVWHHFAHTVSSNAYQTYADGKPVGSGTLTGTPLLFDSRHNLLIGQSGYLASLNASAQAINAGVEVGQKAAAALLALRANDGLVGVSTYTFQTPGPGVYQPTPPFPYSGPQTPWIANMTPFTMSTASQFLPKAGPTPLSSREWAEDYNRTKTWGSLLNSPRTAEQTTIGLFWVPNAGPVYTGMLADLTARHHLNLLDSARLYAMTFAAYGDAFIACINAKYHFNFWRPVTAIQQGDSDGNPETIGDPNWVPLAATPNHPEYPAAHGCITGAVTGVIASFFRTSNVSVNVTATYGIPSALGGGTQTATRSFNNTHHLLREVQLARVYGGMHFHHSVVQGSVLGEQVARHLVENFFRPLR